MRRDVSFEEYEAAWYVLGWVPRAGIANDDIPDYPKIAQTRKIREYWDGIREGRKRWKEEAQARHTEAVVSG
jgi:hypothetical protein